MKEKITKIIDEIKLKLQKRRCERCPYLEKILQLRKIQLSEEEKQRILGAIQNETDYD